MKHLLLSMLPLLLAGEVAWASPPSSLHAFFEELVPGSTPALETRYLSTKAKEQIESTLGTTLASTVIHRYRLQGDNGEVLVYLDRHRVRTLPETLGIALETQTGSILRVSILHFAEPQSYKPRPAWLEQFRGMTARKLPRYKQEIDGMSGATLSGRAVTDACRRSLLIHEALGTDR